VGAAVHALFVQAEDGIRAFHVTGVQTCALPIFRQSQGFNPKPLMKNTGALPLGLASQRELLVVEFTTAIANPDETVARLSACLRSEERRVGKEWRSAWSRRQGGWRVRGGTREWW